MYVFFMEEMQKYDCLYNKYSKSYKDKYIKINYWKKIGEKFDMNAADAEKKFENVKPQTNLLTPTITNKHNDDFELYVTIDRFYKANATLPTKTPTDFIWYATAAYYFTRTITVTNSLTTTVINKTNKQNDDFELYVTKDHFYKLYSTLPTKTPTDFEQYVIAA